MDEAFILYILFVLSKNILYSPILAPWSMPTG